MWRIRIALGFIALALGAIVLDIKTMAPLAIDDGYGGVVVRFGSLSVALLAVSALFILTATGLIASVRNWLVRLFALLPMVMGLILSGAAYGVATDRVLVDSTGITLPGHGFPVHPQHRFEYRTLAAAMVVADRSSEQRDDANLELVRKDGTKVVIPCGDLVRAAMRELVEALGRHDVPFVDMR